MTLSLRARLLLGVVGLVTVALVVAGAATYAALQSFLTDQLDHNLLSDIHPAFQVYARENGSGADSPNGPTAGLPPGSYMALFTPGGGRVGQAVAYYVDANAGTTGTPVLPGTLPAATEDQPALRTVPGRDAVAEYRIAVAPLDEAGGDVFVLAEPLTTVNATLARLLFLEALVGAAVLVATAALAWATVRYSLRPLEDIGGTAAAIAAGDLTRRVEPATPKTEIGRLGLALNAMLAQIEKAFQQRTRSEQQLREFLAAASHELRTPLTSIRGYAEMLRRGAEGSPEDATVARRRIEEEAVRMTSLVDDLLLLARLDQGRPLEREPLDLAKLARDAYADAHAVAPQREITLAAPEAVTLMGDEARLRQVVGNLVRNALVHTPDRSPIEIAVARQDGHATLKVADHGPGLDPEAAAHAFEPFYRADPGRSRDRGGVGLGLSIVAAVVAAHAGKVSVGPTPGGGATFEVLLPISAS